MVMPMASTELDHRVHAGDTGAPTLRRDHILAVEFRSPDGRSWTAIGGGSTLAAAVAFARDSCPGDTSWQIIGWNDVYGE